MRKIFILYMLLLLATSNFAQSKVQKLYEQKKYNKCIKLANKNYAKKKDIQNSLLYKSLALVHIKDTKYAKDFKYPEYKALKTIYRLKKNKKNKNFVKQHQNEIDKIIQINEKIGISFINSKLYGKAKKRYVLLRKTNPNNPYYYYQILKCNYSIDKNARILPDKEILHFFKDEVSKENKQYAIKLFSKLSDSILSLKDYKASEAICRIAIEIDSTNFNLRKKLLHIFIDGKKREQFRKEKKNIINTFSNSDYYNNKAQLYKDYEQFITFLFDNDKFLTLLNFYENENKFFPNDTTIHNINKKIIFKDYKCFKLNTTDTNTGFCKYQVVKDILKLEYNGYFSIVDKNANLENAYKLLDSIVIAAKPIIKDYENKHWGGKTVNEQINILINSNSDLQAPITDYLNNLKSKIYKKFKLKNTKKDTVADLSIYNTFNKDGYNFKITDCDVDSYILYAIGLEYNIPIIPVITKGHMFLIYKINDKDCIRYDTTSEDSCPKKNISYFATTYTTDFFIGDSPEKIKIIELVTVMLSWLYNKNIKKHNKYVFFFYNKTKKEIKDNNIKNDFLTNELEGLLFCLDYDI